MKAGNISCLLCFPVYPADQLRVRITGYIPAPGAAQTICERCGMAVWIGRKQQEAKRQNPKARVLCPLCTTEVAGGKEFVRLASLGGQSAIIQSDLPGDYSPPPPPGN